MNPAISRALIDTVPGAAAGATLIPADSHGERLRNSLLGMGVGLGVSTGARAARNAVYSTQPDDLAELKRSLDESIAAKSAAFQAGYLYTMKVAGLGTRVDDMMNFRALRRDAETADELFNTVFETPNHPHSARLNDILEESIARRARADQALMDVGTAAAVPVGAGILGAGIYNASKVE